MTGNIVEMKALPELLFSLFSTDKVQVIEISGGVHITPVQDENDCTVGLRGILAGHDDMSVDKFLERMRADKELDL